MTVNNTGWQDFKADFKKVFAKMPDFKKLGYNAIARTFNGVSELFNFVFNVKTFFLVLALALASVDVILSASSFTATYHSLGDYALYIVIIFIAAEFGAMKLMLTQMPYRSLPKPIKPRTTSQEKIDRFENNLRNWEVKEKVRKTAHWSKVVTIKFSSFILLIGLMAFFMNFSYAKLSEATTQDVVASEQYDAKLHALQEQRLSLERSIEKQYVAIDNLPENFKSKRDARLQEIADLETLLREVSAQEMRVRTADSVADVVGLQIRYTVEALAETRMFKGITVKEYVGTVNVLLAIGLVLSYLLFFLVSQILTVNKQLFEIKKMRYMK